MSYKIKYNNVNVTMKKKVARINQPLKPDFLSEGSCKIRFFKPNYNSVYYVLLNLSAISPSSR